MIRRQPISLLFPMVAAGAVLAAAIVESLRNFDRPLFDLIIQTIRTFLP